MNTLLQEVTHFFDVPLVSIGTSHLTVGAAMVVVILLLLMITLSGRLKNWIVNILVARKNVDLGTGQAIGSILRYSVIAAGCLVIVQGAGIDLSSLTVMAGAVGIGLGFGLQSLAANIISGLVILFERPIKLGDRIEIGSITGDVIKIALRATVVRTNDNIDIIVPNTEFITTKVTNWSYSDRDIRFSFPVGVSYNADPAEVSRILMSVAKAHPGVLDMPEPDVILNDFGDRTLNFMLRVWTREFCTRPRLLRSDLNLSILEQFKKGNIEVQFSQLAVNMESGNSNAPPVRSIL